MTHFYFPKTPPKIFPLLFSSSVSLCLCGSKSSPSRCKKNAKKKDIPTFVSKIGISLTFLTKSSFFLPKKDKKLNHRDTEEKRKRGKEEKTKAY